MMFVRLCCVLVGFFGSRDRVRIFWKWCGGCEGVEEEVGLGRRIFIVGFCGERLVWFSRY